MRFEFCPTCAAELDPPDDEFTQRCKNCGSTWYQNPAPTVGCAVLRDGKALVSRRGGDPYKGKCDAVGGFLHPGESAIEGLRREVKEETGLDIEVGIEDCLQMVPHRYGDDGAWTLAIGFKARWREGDPQPSSDVDELKWVTSDELDDLDFAWPHDRDLVRKALSHGG